MKIIHFLKYKRSRKNTSIILRSVPRDSAVNLGSHLQYDEIFKSRLSVSNGHKHKRVVIDTSPRKCLK